jgi:hypothetical protein
LRPNFKWPLTRKITKRPRLSVMKSGKGNKSKPTEQFQRHLIFSGMFFYIQF